MTKWKQFIRGLETISQISVPRYYHIHQHTPITLQIHGFSNASKRAYNAVVYLSLQQRNSEHFYSHIKDMCGTYEEINYT